MYSWPAAAKRPSAYAFRLGRPNWSVNRDRTRLKEIGALKSRLEQRAEMAADGWWWRDERLTQGAIRSGILREMLAHR
jgi:hypothetical protein